MEYQGKPRANVTQHTKTLVEVLRWKMQKLGITQKELSDKTEISEPTLSRIFKLSRVPDINELEKISTALNIKLSRLIAEVESNLPKSSTPPAPPPVPPLNPFILPPDVTLAAHDDMYDPELEEYGLQESP